MSNHLISIIIPVFNRANLIIPTLVSISEQSFEDYECLIIDDGSTDSTEAVVLKFIETDNRFKFYKRPLNRTKGPNACRNYGFEKAKGEFIYFFDSDDYLKPNALETFIKGFTFDTDGVLAQVERVDHKSGVLKDINVIESNNLIEDYFTYKICYFVCGMLWKKKFLEQQNELFDELIGNHDEWDFNLRMIYARPKIVKLKHALVIYYQYQDSFKNEVRKGNDEAINSAFRARHKHLRLLVNQHPKNKEIFTKHIANYYSKTVRNKLISNQTNWFRYYKAAVIQKLKTKSFLSIIKLTLGVISLKLIGKGYSFFE